jgi:hypothetical protein
MPHLARSLRTSARTLSTRVQFQMAGRPGDVVGAFIALQTFTGQISATSEDATADITAVAGDAAVGTISATLVDTVGAFTAEQTFVLPISATLAPATASIVAHTDAVGGTAAEPIVVVVQAGARLPSCPRRAPGPQRVFPVCLRARLMSPNGDLIHAGVAAPTRWA